MWKNIQLETHFHTTNCPSKWHTTRYTMSHHKITCSISYNWYREMSHVVTMLSPSVRARAKMRDIQAHRQTHRRRQSNYSLYSQLVLINPKWQYKHFPICVPSSSTYVKLPSVSTDCMSDIVAVYGSMAGLGGTTINARSTYNSSNQCHTTCSSGRHCVAFDYNQVCLTPCK